MRGGLQGSSARAAPVDWLSDAPVVSRTLPATYGSQAASTRPLGAKLHLLKKQLESRRERSAPRLTAERPDPTLMSGPSLLQPPRTADPATVFPSGGGMDPFAFEFPDPDAPPVARRRPLQVRVREDVGEYRVFAKYAGHRVRAVLSCCGPCRCLWPPTVDGNGWRRRRRRRRHRRRLANRRRRPAERGGCLRRVGCLRPHHLPSTAPCSPRIDLSPLRRTKRKGVAARAPSPFSLPPPSPQTWTWSCSMHATHPRLRCAPACRCAVRGVSHWAAPVCNVSLYSTSCC